MVSARPRKIAKCSPLNESPLCSCYLARRRQRHSNQHKPHLERLLKLIYSLYRLNGKINPFQLVWLAVDRRPTKRPGSYSKALKSFVWICQNWCDFSENVRILPNCVILWRSIKYSSLVCIFANNICKQIPSFSLIRSHKLYFLQLYLAIEEQLPAIEVHLAPPLQPHFAPSQPAEEENYPVLYLLLI